MQSFRRRRAHAKLKFIGARLRRTPKSANLAKRISVEM
jgi:hypothetical protein